MSTHEGDLMAQAERERTMASESAPVCGCGLPMSRNPHPDAGKPNQAGVEVGYAWECIPCLVKTRNRVGRNWRAADRALADLRDRLDKAHSELLRLAASTENASELFRLESKASGVTLAASYAREASEAARAGDSRD